MAEVLITLGIIGVVAAMTLPSLMAKHRRQVTETRLKHSYSLLSQVIENAKVDHSDIENWDFKDIEYFTNTYIIPYIKKTDSKITYQSNVDNFDRNTIKFANGNLWQFSFYDRFENPKPFIRIAVDINGDNKPNRRGYDIFDFYLFPAAKSFYNGGDGNIAYNVPKSGLYYDGYGQSDEKLKTDKYRGCTGNLNNSDIHFNSFCVGIIIRNGWKIPDNYPMKL